MQHAQEHGAAERRLLIRHLERESMHGPRNSWGHPDVSPRILTFIRLTQLHEQAHERLDKENGERR